MTLKCFLFLRDLQDNDIYTVEAGAFETLKKLISLYVCYSFF